MDKIKIAIVGIRGYGEHYLEVLLNKESDEWVLQAAISRNPEKSKFADKLKKRNVKFYTSLDDFYKDDHADLVILNSPIHLHKQHSITAMKNGSNVLCEKPAAATIQDALEMKKVSEETGKFLAIGYQWSFSKAISALKEDIIIGKLGKPLIFKTLVMWPRPEKYYTRNEWAGKLKVGNEWVLDSVAGNATNHFIHNMLYVLGDTIYSSDQIEWITAEAYRVNHIENFDTCVFKACTSKGVKLFYIATHACRYSIGPILLYTFEKAKVYYSSVYESDYLICRYNDGRIKNYGTLGMNEWNKVWDCIEAVKNCKKPVCCIETSLPAVTCINGIHESLEIDKRIITVSPEATGTVITDKGEKMLVISNIDNLLTQCYDQELMLSEYGSLKWATGCGMNVSLNDYKYFPRFNSI